MTFCIGTHRNNDRTKTLRIIMSCQSTEVKSSFYLTLARKAEHLQPHKADELWNEWLGSHVQDRTTGKPQAVTPEEVVSLLAFAHVFSSSFSNFVSTICRFPVPKSISHRHILRLERSAERAQAPLPMARLLIWILECPDIQLYWKKELVACVHGAVLSLDSEFDAKRLTSLLMLCGCPDSEGVWQKWQTHHQGLL